MAVAPAKGIRCWFGGWRRGVRRDVCGGSGLSGPWFVLFFFVDGEVPAYVFGVCNVQMLKVGVRCPRQPDALLFQPGFLCTLVLYYGAGQTYVKGAANASTRVSRPGGVLHRERAHRLGELQKRPLAPEA